MSLAALSAAAAADNPGARGAPAGMGAGVGAGAGVPPGVRAPMLAPPPGAGGPPPVLLALTGANEGAWVSVGRLAALMGDSPAARAAFESAIGHNPFSAAALTELGALLRAHEEYGKAAECYERLLHLQAHNGEAWAALGFCYLMQNDLASAHTAYQHALYHIANPKDAALWYGIGLLYDRYGSLEHAEKAFEAVLSMAPRFERAEEVRFRLAVLAKQQGRHDAALAALRGVAESASSQAVAADAYSQIGHVHELRGEAQPARTAYERVLAVAPDNGKVLQQLGWLCHSLLGEKEAALGHLQRAVSVDPNDGQAWYLLGRCYVGQGELERAYAAYERAVHVDPSNASVWCSLGVLYYQLSQHRDALDAYSRAINLNPGIAEVWYNVGTLYDTCGQTSDALDAYRKAAELGTDPTFIQERLQALAAKSAPGPPSAPSGPSGPAGPAGAAPAAPAGEEAGAAVEAGAERAEGEAPPQANGGEAAPMQEG